jgi:cytochrome c biogenesis protein CcdA
MLALALLVVSIAVADSLNPGTIAPALYFATGARPVRTTLAFAAGVFAVNLVGGIALLLGPGRLALGALPHPGADTKQLAELGLGVVALVGAVALWRVRHRLRDRYARAARRSDRASLLVGAAIAAVELPTALPYFAAIAALAGGSESVTFQVTLLAAFNLVFVAPVLLVAALAGVTSGRSAARMERVRARLLAHIGTLVAGVLLLIGIALVVVGATGAAR